MSLTLTLKFEIFDLKFQIEDFKFQNWHLVDGQAMKYKRFEELPVWQDAIKLAVAVYALTARGDFKGQSSLRDQIERASVSVSNNIAEGFERGTTNELLALLYIARGSAGEVRSMLHLLERLPAFSDLKSDILNLKSSCERVSRQLGAWAEALKKSDIKGQRYLNDKSRQVSRAATEREEFLEELRRVRDEDATHTRRTAAGN
jgi:four helix bundle protein